MTALSDPLSFNTSTVLLALTGLFLSYYTATSILAWRRLRAFPGPATAAFSYAWLIRLSLSGRMGEIAAAAIDRYGAGTRSTVRVGPNELVTSDPDFVRRTSAARSRWTRSAWYTLYRLDPYDDSMFSTLDGAKHDALKSQTAAGYAGRDVDGLEDDVDSVLVEMVEKVKKKYAARGDGRGGKKPLLDLATMVQYFTLDSITKVAFGQKFGFLDTESDVHGYNAVIKEIAPASVTASHVPWLGRIVSSNLVLRLMGPKDDDKRGIGKLMGTLRPIVAKHFAPGAKPKKDMLGSFMAHGLTQSQCNMEAIFQIAAGNDTTATAIRATMLYIMTAPRVYHALRNEIDTAIAKGKISSPITNAEGAELPYLQAVILEGLRMHPPFQGLSFKVAPPEGDEIDGVFVPGGTWVAPAYRAFTRRPEVFGEDADEFRPERWLEADAGRAAEMRRVVDLVFGYGRWGCAGRFLAFMELNKVFVELLRAFDFQLANPLKPWDSLNYNMFIQKDFWVRVSLRDGADKKGVQADH